jgi:hypothetical protein
VEPDAAFWRRLASDYKNAAKQLTDPGARRESTERAKAAEDTARALGTK